MKHVIKEATLINEGKTVVEDVLVNNGRIQKIAESISEEGAQEINGAGKWLFPGLIDDQVHFREPGLTHKAELATESRAAVAGGVTSYMEMPNTKPGATTIDLMEQKYARAAEVSPANYSFFMGTTNDNLDELLKVDPKKVCGVKIFMGSSTGNMLVDDQKALDRIFGEVKTLIATHCEDDHIIAANAAVAREKYGDDVPAEQHPIIRSREACYASSSFAVELAKKHGTRLHILHISTKEELDLFRNDIPMSEKHITSEACIHHLWFSREDYEEKGFNIKWNPAVKESEDRDAVLQAVRDGRIDVIATDHAPHTIQEKSGNYWNAPSGGPLVQHSLQALIDLHRKGELPLEMIAQKAAHNVADMFSIVDRGYIREGYFADLVLVDPEKPYTVTKDNLLYKCGWSPFEGHTFSSSIEMTMVNGAIVWNQGELIETKPGMRLAFDR